MTRRNEFEEILGAIVSVFVLLFLIYIFYTTPSPIQSFFQNFVNEIIYGILLIIGVVVVAILIYKYVLSPEGNSL